MIRLSPNLLSYALHKLEFCPLLLLGELVANGTRGEAALR